MNKTTLFSIVVFVQLCILIVLGYFMNIRLYLYGDRFGSHKIKGIFPQPKRVNELGNGIENNLEWSNTNDLLVKLGEDMKVIGENRKTTVELESEMPDSYGKKNIAAAIKGSNDNVAPVAPNHPSNEEDKKDPLSATNDNVSPVTTNHPSNEMDSKDALSANNDNLSPNEEDTKVALSTNNDNLSPVTAKLKPQRNSSHGLLYSDSIERKKVVKNVDLLIMVLTAPSKLQRRRYIRQTWWKDCRDKMQVACWFFTDRLDSITDEKVGSEIQIEQDVHKDIIFTPVNPGIAFGFRFLYLIQWAKANYNFKYALRIDDDMMLCVDHLMWDLPHFPSQNVHYGWLHCQGKGLVYVDEGLVMFSSDLIEKFLAQDADKMLCHPYGDQQISIWEQEIGLNQTEVIRADNGRIHHSPPASYDKNLKNLTNLCHHYIAIHGLYKDDMLEFWNRRGDGQQMAYSRYTENKVGGFCAHEPYLNWRHFGGIYRQEPKPCLGNPVWNINGFKVYPGRERRYIAETELIDDSIYKDVLGFTED